MNKKSDKRITEYGIVFFFVTAVVRCMFYDEHSCGSEFIEDYQTLITGIAAVAAAVMTIREMRKSDEQARKNHEQMLEATMFPELKKIDTFVGSIETACSLAAQGVKACNEIANKISDECDDNWQNAEAGCAEKYINEISKKINRSDIEELALLFNCKTIDQLNMVREILKPDNSDSSIDKLTQLEIKLPNFLDCATVWRRVRRASLIPDLTTDKMSV